MSKVDRHRRMNPSAVHSLCLRNPFGPEIEGNADSKYPIDLKVLDFNLEMLADGQIRVCIYGPNAIGPGFKPEMVQVGACLDVEDLSVLSAWFNSLYLQMEALLDSVGE